MIAEPGPLILSLELDEDTFRALDQLRKEHFPPERNFLSAHLTLFHKLPPEREGELRALLKSLAAETPPIEMRSTGYRFLGRGVALDFHAPGLAEVRARIAQAFAGNLSPQDERKLKPHVTVQNKVDPAQARALFDELQAAFSPRAATGAGLLLWRYRNGPWEFIERFPFARSRTAQI